MSERKTTPLAADVKFLLCEDVRHETSGKLLIVGLYPGERVLVHQAEPAAGVDAQAVVASLCLLFIACKGLGRFESRFEITAPDGRSVANAKGGPVELGEGKSATVYAMFRPFPILAFGEHRIRMCLDETAYEYIFDIRRVSAKSSRKLPGRSTKAARRSMRKTSG